MSIHPKHSRLGGLFSSAIPQNIVGQGSLYSSAILQAKIGKEDYIASNASKSKSDKEVNFSSAIPQKQSYARKFV